MVVLFSCVVYNYFVHFNKVYYCILSLESVSTPVKYIRH